MAAMVCRREVETTYYHTDSATYLMEYNDSTGKKMQLQTAMVN